MAFGVFDGIHEGHRMFLKEAKSCGDYLVAVAAQDSHVELLKGHSPKFCLAERLEALKEESVVDEAIPGDERIGTWGVVKKYRPEIIALGYDQQALKRDLESRMGEFDWHPEIRVMGAHEPRKNHSSLINKQITP